MTHAANVWNKFCQRFNVVEQSVPLFTTDATAWWHTECSDAPVAQY